jgi:hypothetical protein
MFAVLDHDFRDVDHVGKRFRLLAWNEPLSAKAISDENFMLINSKKSR